MYFYYTMLNLLLQLNRKLLEYDQRFSELQAEISRIREGCSETSASSSSKSSQFFAAPSQTTPAVGSALFVAANMVCDMLLFCFFCEYASHFGQGGVQPCYVKRSQA